MPMTYNELSDLVAKAEKLNKELANAIKELTQDYSGLATVAKTGSYNDLENKPFIPAGQIPSDWNQNNPDAVDFIKNKPTIPAPYSLPIASANVLGGVKVGTGLSIDQDGKLNAQGGSSGHVYLHNISGYTSNKMLSITIINNTPDVIDNYEKLGKALYDLGYTSNFGAEFDATVKYVVVMYAVSMTGYKVGRMYGYPVSASSTGYRPYLYYDGNPESSITLSQLTYNDTVTTLI